MAKDNMTKSMLNFFNINYKKSSKTKPIDKLFPTKTIDKDGETIRVREKFPPQIEKYYYKWLHSTHDNAESWRNRTLLYEDCDLMYYNSTIVAKAIELIADEVVQADAHEQSITVEAKRKQKKAILKFFDEVNIHSLIRSTAADIVHYGNHGWILSFDDNGIDEIIPSNIYDLKERIEFSPPEIREEMIKQNKFLSDYRAKVHRIDQLIDMIENKDNITSYYKKYLFGFHVGEYVLPPWRYIHFRNFTTKSPFKPYGVPVLVHAIAAYRQYDAAMTMQQTARAARIPIDIYKLSLPNVMNETEKLSRAIEFISEWQNAGINNVNKEETGVGETIVTIDNLIEFDQKVSDIDLGKMDDIEMLRDDIIIATMLPRYLLDPNDSMFGDSGISLVEKWKPFARLVYRIQSIILENLSQVIKIHLLHTGEFALEDIDFILKMPFPESQTNSDIIDSQNDLRDLATGLVDDLADKFFDGDIDVFPDELLRDIYSYFLPYDAKTMDSWMDQLLKVKNEGDELDEKVIAIKKQNKYQKLIEKFGSKNRLKEEIFSKAFDYKQQILRQGSIKGKHYYSSKNQYTEFPAEQLRELDVRKLKDKDGNKKKLTEVVEEIKYEFKYDEPSKNQTKRKKKKQK